MLSEFEGMSPIEVLRKIRKEDPTLWLALWRIPDGEKFGDKVWLSGKGWSNLPGAWVSPDMYKAYREIANNRSVAHPRNAELERTLREAGLTGERIENPTGWNDEGTASLAEAERVSRVLGDKRNL